MVVGVITRESIHKVGFLRSEYLQSVYSELRTLILIQNLLEGWRTG